jgi:hypothetical protein
MFIRKKKHLAKVAELEAQIEKLEAKAGYDPMIYTATEFTPELCDRLEKEILDKLYTRFEKVFSDRVLNIVFGILKREQPICITGKAADIVDGPDRAVTATVVRVEAFKVGCEFMTYR